jgi:RNA polymerase sigma factor, sigma-70 family
VHSSIARLRNPVEMAERPGLLARLLESHTLPDQDEAWAKLVEAHSDQLLRTARYFGGDHDAVMDRYVFILEHLRRDQFRRLRGYSPRDDSSFDVWLVAVARRLCLDHYRHRYGRVKSDRMDEERTLERSGRRRLVDLLGEALEVTAIPDPGRDAPDEQLAAKERHQALTAALDALAPSDRLLLRLLYEEELTARETARLMRLPTLFHVYRRRNQLLTLLRAQLQSHGVHEVEP